MNSAHPPRSGTREILIVARHSATRYSGGRYHAWIMGEALAAAGDKVTVWTNETPHLIRDFAEFPAHDSIALAPDPAFSSLPKGRFDVVIIVPDLGVDWRHYAAAINVARRDTAHLVLLNFESPNWFNALSTHKRNPALWGAWLKSSRFADLIISSTEEGTRWARRYYGEREGLLYRSCFPAINSLAAEAVEATPQNQIICITRLDRQTRHKGAQVLVQAIACVPPGYRFVVIGRIDDSTAQTLQASARKNAVELVQLQGVTDLEKFTEIRRSRLMIFLSEFEGFGYPPVEALFCNVPCIASDLPVLRETCGDALHYLPVNDTAGLCPAMQKALAEPMPEPGSLKSSVAERVSFESYVERLRQLLDELRSQPPRSAGHKGRSLDLGLLKSEAAMRSAAIKILRPLRNRAAARA